jgi:hypothetical protein
MSTDYTSLMLLGILGLLAAAVSACAAWRDRTSWGTLSRARQMVAAASAPALFAVLALAAWCSFQPLGDLWSFIRLMPSVAIIRGYSLYYPEGTGPLLGWSYGPLMPLLQLPAALLPDPIAATLAAGALNQAMLLVPLLMLAWIAMPPGLPARAAGVLILAALQAVMVHLDPSAYWMKQIQVDTVAMGLALLSFLPLLGADPAAPVSPRRLWIAATLFTGAIFTKQNEVCLLPLLLGFVAVRDGPRPALRMAGAVAAVSGAALLLCVIAFGGNAVYLNMWRVPALHPWSAGWRGLASIAVRFLEQISGMAAVFLGLWLASLKILPRVPTRRERLIQAPWAMPAAAALLMFPISVAGGVKVGGGDNSNHSLYYLVAAVATLAARLAAQERPAVRIGVPAAAFVAAVAAIGVFLSASEPRTLEWRGSRLDREYRFAREHPGQVWFGANPLVTLYTDRKLYHHGYGVYDRTLPGLNPPERQLAEHLPAAMRWSTTPGDPFWSPSGGRPIRRPEGQFGFWFEH